MGKLNKNTIINERFIIKDINVMSNIPTQVSSVIVLERLSREKELIDIQKKVLKGFNK